MIDNLFGNHSSLSITTRLGYYVKIVSLLSLIPIGFFSFSCLFPYFSYKDSSLFLRDPYFLLSLSTLLFTLYPISRIFSGEKAEKVHFFLLFLFFIFSKPLLFTGLMPSETLRDIILMGYLAILVLSFLPVPLMLTLFLFDMVLLLVYPVLRGISFPVVLPLIYSFIALTIAFVIKKEINIHDKLYWLFDQSRYAASEFIRINMRMQDSVDRSASVARSGERDRIAREIHDTVGYTLTALLLQIQANQEVLLAEDDKSILMKRLKSQESLIRTVINDVRKEVHNMHSESGLKRNAKPRWERLCQVFADSTGIRISFHFSKNLEIVSDLISDNIYRIIQESLTNSYRHGAADFIDISMVWEDDEAMIYLRVSDNGKGCSTYEIGSGLRGMKERTEQMKGDIFWQSQREKGFDLGITIPWKGREDDAI
jgi:signal transduction histidine kinase